MIFFEFQQLRCLKEREKKTVISVLVSRPLYIYVYILILLQHHNEAHQKRTRKREKESIDSKACSNEFADILNTLMSHTHSGGSILPHRVSSEESRKKIGCYACINMLVMIQEKQENEELFSKCKYHVK